VRDIIQGGTIGAVTAIDVRQFKKADNQPAQTWKTDPTVGGGGSFVDMQSHTLDWLTYLFDMPVQVTGVKKNTQKLHTAEDFVSFLFDYDGFAAVGLCSYAAAHEEESVTIYGELGRVSMGFFRPSAISLVIGDEEQDIHLPDPQHVHQPFVERVVPYFLDDAPNPCSVNEGRLSMELMDQIFRERAV